ncbi:MAG: hypothetical protein AABZ47_07325 [Planctomycetota bacterium]
MGGAERGHSCKIFVDLLTQGDPWQKRIDPPCKNENANKKSVFESKEKQKRPRKNGSVETLVKMRRLFRRLKITAPAQAMELSDSPDGLLQIKRFVYPEQEKLGMESLKWNFFVDPEAMKR